MSGGASLAETGNSILRDRFKDAARARIKQLNEQNESFSRTESKCDGACQERKKNPPTYEFEIELGIDAEFSAKYFGGSAAATYKGTAKGTRKDGQTQVNGHTVYYKDAIVPDKIEMKKKGEVKGNAGLKAEGAGGVGGGVSINGTGSESFTTPSDWSPSGDVPGAEDH